jgi:hypothetical protein
MAEARTEAGLMGAAGATRMAAARTEEVAGRGTREAGRILAQAARAAVVGATSSVAAIVAAVDLAAVDRTVVRQWRGQEERDNLAADMEPVDTVAVLRALRADIRPGPTEAVTAERVTDTAAVTDQAERVTATAAMRAAPVPATGTVDTTALTGEALALRDQAVRTAAVIPVRGRKAPTETRMQTRATGVALTGQHRIEELGV